MTLTQEQIKKLSINLSKIEIDTESFGSNANDILWYMEMLNEIDTTDVKPTISVSNIQNKLRTDEESKKEISREQLLNSSKQKIIADQIAISNIMN